MSCFVCYVTNDIGVFLVILRPNQREVHLTNVPWRFTYIYQKDGMLMFGPSQMTGLLHVGFFSGRVTL